MESKNLKGGEFIIKDADATSMFIPEEYLEEQQMIAASCRDFLEQEVNPNHDRIDSLEEHLLDYDFEVLIDEHPAKPEDGVIVTGMYFEGC